MRRLSGLDAAFVYFETPTNHMHVGVTAVFDPGSVPGGYSFGKVRALVDGRLDKLPPFRRRLIETPLELHHPVWIEDGDFDLDFHLRRVALASPGSMDQLTVLAADLMGRPLDRRRPLWEMLVIEELERGLIALVAKIHHAAIDGVSGLELLVNLLDLEVHPPSQGPVVDSWRPERLPSRVELAAAALFRLGSGPPPVGPTGGRAARAARSGRLRPEPARAPADAPRLFAAPKTPLNRAVTPKRALACASLALQDLRWIKRSFGTTVNDVVLAVCAGGLRRYLDEWRETSTKPLVAMVPMSLRTGGRVGVDGNQVSGMLASLATDVDDPAERLQAIHRSTTTAKLRRPTGGPAIGEWMEFMPPAVARAARLYSRTRLADRHRPPFNLVISNLPGPQIPLYLTGAAMTAVYPMGPIFDGVGLNITVMSYLDQIHFGIVACPDVVPDLQRLPAVLEESLAELKDVANKTHPDTTTHTRPDTATAALP